MGDPHPEHRSEERARSGPAVPDVDQLQGLAVCPGFAAGPLYTVAPAPTLPAPGVPGPSEGDHALAALAEVAVYLRSRAEGATNPTVAQILIAQATMAEDPVLHDAVSARVA